MQNYNDENIASVILCTRGDRNNTRQHRVGKYTHTRIGNNKKNTTSVKITHARNYNSKITASVSIRTRGDQRRV
jgi:hypothetical protein